MVTLADLQLGGMFLIPLGIRIWMGMGLWDDGSHYLHRDEVDRDARAMGEIRRYIQDPNGE